MLYLITTDRDWRPRALPFRWSVCGLDVECSPQAVVFGHLVPNWWWCCFARTKAVDPRVPARGLCWQTWITIGRCLRSTEHPKSLSRSLCFLRSHHCKSPLPLTKPLSSQASLLPWQTLYTVSESVSRVTISSLKLRLSGIRHGEEKIH